MNDRKRGVVIGSGSRVSKEKLLAAIEKSDFTIAADGGAQYAVHLGIQPDLLVGDFDSIAESDLQYFREAGVPIEQFPKEKDETDMELAIRLLEEKEIREITLFGASGSRLDHTFLNTLLILKAKKRETKIILIDETNEIRALEEKMTITKRDGYLSVMPVDSSILISLSGVEYPLERKRIYLGDGLGVSNEITSEFATVECHEGEGLLFLSTDE